MVDLPHYVYPVKELVYHPRVRGWCKLRYPNHPKGCPNYGKHLGCPPQCAYVTQIFEMKAVFYLVHSEFDLASHVERMREKHPYWTERQLRNVLYWQGRSKKQLKQRVEEAQNLLGCDTYHTYPEAAGVHMYVTCIKSGLRLEKIKNITVCKHVALLGWSKR